MQLAFMSECMENYKQMSVDITKKGPNVSTVAKPQDLTWMPFAGKVTFNKTPSDSYMIGVPWPNS